MKRGRGWSECRISDIPEEILMDIVSRLSIKTIATFRCVSKTWRRLLSSSNTQFTKLHFNRSPVQFIQETGFSSNVYLHIVELEDDTGVVGKTIKLLPSRFRLSRCDLVALNSCNGFLCLAFNSHSQFPVKVCNPITGEYLNFPKHKMYDYTDCYRDKDVVSGFGICAKTNQYKVVMLAYRKEYNPVTGSRFTDRMVEVYTIGTKSWRTIGIAPKYPDRLRSTTFFNGAIHWICYDIMTSSNYIVSFDLETEEFGIVPPPTHFSMEPITESYKIKIGVLGEFLYLSYDKELWVMKEYGVQESWTKLYVGDRSPLYSCEAVKYLSGGKILMNYDGKRLFSYDPAEKISKELEVPLFCIRFKTIPHVPSFMSLNDAMMGDEGAKLRTRMCRILKRRN